MVSRLLDSNLADTNISKAEFLPPLRGNIAKVTWVMPFTNLDGELSCVKDVSDSSLGEREKDKVISWLQSRLPGIKWADMKIQSFWLVYARAEEMTTN